MIDKLILTKEDRMLIHWFTWEYLKLHKGWKPDQARWIAAIHSSAHGGKGWEPVRQGATGITGLIYWYQNIHKLGSKEWRPAIIIRAALAVANGIKATSYLEKWLAIYHSHYTINDVIVSQSRGYLECTKPCTGGYPCIDETHYHTIYIAGIKGYGRGAYAFWRALKAGEIISVAPPITERKRES